jgi:1-phosphatidylinositol phosphodiesterase
VSKKTALCIVNFSGQDITNISVSESGFDTPNGPTHFLQGNSIVRNSSLCDYVEINNSGTSEFTLDLTFGNNKGHLSFKDDQQKSQDKNVGQITPITATGTASNLEVWQTTGGNVHTISDSSSTYGTNGIYIRSRPKPDNSSWMGDLVNRKPDVRLNGLAMPGSHDAGVYTGSTTDYNLGGGGEWAATQGTPIIEQLRAGSRYFDIRVCLYDDHLVTYHGESGYGAYGAKLGTVLGDVRDFLSSEKGKNEAVFLRFKRPDIHSVHNSTERTVEVVKNTVLRDFLYTPQNINAANLKLSDLKGKVVAAFDDAYESFWPPAANSVYPYYEIDDPNSVKPSGLNVYDNYADDGRYEQMYADQEPKLNTYGGWGNGHLFLLSWTLSGGGAVSDIEVLAGMANPWLPKKLSQIENAGTNRPNIVYLDFIDPYLCSAIIELNT